MIRRSTNFVGSWHQFNHPLGIRLDIDYELLFDAPPVHEGPGRYWLRESDFIQQRADEAWMAVALEEADRACEEGEVPVGAVIVLHERPIARAHNQVIAQADPSAHAEVLAIRGAASLMQNYRLPGATIYVTIEPCIMCAGAILQARLHRVVYGAADPKQGAVSTLYGLLDDDRLNHRASVTGGIRADECAEIISRFFQGKRLISTPASEP
jgi:tRNA(adenine34) deaminase